MFGITRKTAQPDPAHLALEREVSELRQALAAAEAAHASAVLDAQHAQEESRFFKGLTTHLQTFGQSFHHFQASLAALAQTMKTEKGEAMRTAEVSGQSSVAIERISRSLQ